MNETSSIHAMQHLVHLELTISWWVVSLLWRQVKLSRQGKEIKFIQESDPIKIVSYVFWPFLGKGDELKLQKFHVFAHVLEFFGWSDIENFPASQCDISYLINCLLADINNGMYPWINDFFTPLNDGIAGGIILVGLETDGTGRGAKQLLLTWLAYM